ncbi:hypothetical protein [Pseudomonas sp. Marseille-Q5115]|uniref:hypothetical protein n=1 Tax=Pseudomonas sp. Marseille-Q5115 TaxID=2866593 RepID=UPI001CE438BA|nr:hypothetical protein [Pseudomonas sp. Marseille-Q5115]
MTDRARSEFNTWWERQPFKDQFADVKDQMGNVWVASREECVVVLPEINPRDWACTLDECLAIQQGIDMSQRRIRAAGLRVEVKP